MTLDTSQLGRAGERALSLYSLITPEGQVQLPEWLVTLTRSANRNKLWK